jgi:hypothetical protein
VPEVSPSSGGGGSVTCNIKLLYQQEMVRVRVTAAAAGRELVTGTGEWTSFDGAARKRIASTEVVTFDAKVCSSQGIDLEPLQVCLLLVCLPGACIL